MVMRMPARQFIAPLQHKLGLSLQGMLMVTSGSEILKLHYS